MGESMKLPTPEHIRLAAHGKRSTNWKLWGPYLSERAWGTVREDYSAGGQAWTSFPHDQAMSRAYRWNEDGLGGLSDRNQYLCFGLALWNGRDPILKERLFGLTGPEGNHGEDVKEYYWYLDSTPTHSYMQMLYKYPQRGYPYERLRQEAARRGRTDPEFELVDTGVFDGQHYFDVYLEYAKESERDILINIRVVNRGPEVARIVVLPQLWFRNTWSWGFEAGPMGDTPQRPRMRRQSVTGDVRSLVAGHPTLGAYYFSTLDAQDLIFTENETNAQRIFGSPNRSAYVKDAFHRYIISGERGAVNPAGVGTKAAAVYHLELGPSEERSIKLRLSDTASAAPFEDFDVLVSRRKSEADAFYRAVQNPNLSDDLRRIQRQAFAGLLWSKQLYYYDVEQWLSGDPILPAHPSRLEGRNAHWQHLTNFDVISMPDKWEFPWYATWDLAFHCIPFAMVDVDFAKRQLELISREWYMHPNGQLPAYEWNFSDVNPPVHAWAAWRVYKIEARTHGHKDRDFLEGIFHKLMLNFTWWVNRKDAEQNNIFQGGFLGLDNIGVFDRSAELPTGGHLNQADGTSWMAAFSLQMMEIALELAHEAPVYQNMASKFFEHYLRVADAMSNTTTRGFALWDEDDGFFYDAIQLPDGRSQKLKVRSLVGLMPMFAVDIIEPSVMARMPTFNARVHWFLKNRAHLTGNITGIDEEGVGSRRLVSIVTRERLVRLLSRMLDEEEFLSDYGIRSMSKYHHDHPYELQIGKQSYRVKYEPAESESGIFGGNSNWRGPIWFPINYLLIEALQKYHRFYGDSLKVECPTGSGRFLNLEQIAHDLSLRLIKLFERDQSGRRPALGSHPLFQSDPHFRDHLLFYEHFHGDSGRGLGASHQTGWTALVAKLIQQAGGFTSDSERVT